MKTQTHFTQRQKLKVLFYFLIIAILAFNPIYAQQTNTNTIKGLVVSENDQPLQDVNIIQKGTNNGVITNAKGEFTFPVKLNTGDVLIFSYLGYETQNITITETTTFIKLALNPDLVEILGSLDTNVPYKSKRKN